MDNRNKSFTVDLSKNLGGGTFAKVYLGTYFNPIKNKNKKAAIKIQTEPHDHSIDDEYEIFQMIGKYRKAHPDDTNAAALLTCFKKGSVKIGNLYKDALVLEFMNLGSVEDQVKRKAFGWDEYYPVMRGAAQGLSALHAMGIVHCDMKPANVLMKKKGDVITGRLADVGLAKKKDAFIDNSGTPMYMAPEVIAKKMPHSEKSDVFGWSAIVCFIANGKDLYSFASAIGNITQYIWTEQKRENINPGAPQKIAHLITFGFAHQVVNRANAAELVEEMETEIDTISAKLAQYKPVRYS